MVTLLPGNSTIYYGSTPCEPHHVCIHGVYKIYQVHFEKVRQVHLLGPLLHPLVPLPGLRELRAVLSRLLLRLWLGINQTSIHNSFCQAFRLGLYTLYCGPATLHGWVVSRL